MNYPLIFNTQEEHVLHIKNNKEFYKSILLEDENVIHELVEEKYKKSSIDIQTKEKMLEESKVKLELEKKQVMDNKREFEKLKVESVENKTRLDEMIKMIQTLSSEKQKLTEKSEKQKEVIELAEKKIGEHSMYKGKFNEEFTHMCLSDEFSDFEIEGKGQTHCMDKRMVHRFKNYTIGIECKDKDKITTQDINKFRKDKITNKFKGCIFISTSKINDIVVQEDDFKLMNDELFIYSKNKEIIITIIKIFINYIETDKDESKLMYLMGDFRELYKQWISTKKNIMDFDKFFWTILEKNGIDINVKGNLFLVPLSKCKSGKKPY